MSAIKEIPTNFRVYYTSMRDTYTRKKENATELLNELKAEHDELKEDIHIEYQMKGKDYGISLEKYSEYVNDKYSTGEFLRAAKGFFINKHGDYELVGSRFNLYRFAKLQKEIHKVETDIAFYDKMLALTLKEYQGILKLYYYKVHEKMICEGSGYVFGEGIGWVCINRCKMGKQKARMDFAASRKKKEELIAQGLTPYNKEEANFCAMNGLEYHGVQYRVMKVFKDYDYEIAFLDCRIPKGDFFKFEKLNYYGRNLRDKTNEELIEQCNGDIREVCKLDLDLKAKLDLCLEINPLLYSKFIRNEEQHCHNYVEPTNRKS